MVKVEAVDGCKVSCDRCKRRPVTLRASYSGPVGWTRLLCPACWEATKDRDPLAMIRDGDGTV